MADYTRARMERIADCGLKWARQFSVGFHMWLMFSITGFQEGESFSLLSTETWQDDTNDGTCAPPALSAIIDLHLHPSHSSHFYASLLTNWMFRCSVLTLYLWHFEIHRPGLDAWLARLCFLRPSGSGRCDPGGRFGSPLQASSSTSCHCCWCGPAVS